MKSKLSCIAILIGLLSLNGCSKFLSQIPDDVMTEDLVFTSRSTAEKFLANVYSYIPQEWSQNTIIWPGASDEGKYSLSWFLANYYNFGTYTSIDLFLNRSWENYWKGIRAATIFIEKIDKVTLDINDEQKARYKAEARTLRAMYYFYLIRAFGPVMLLGETTIPVDAPRSEINKPRNSMDECVSFITSELDKAAPFLPVRPINEPNYARITKGVALSFKARTFLLSASPLFNGNTDYAALKNKDGKQLISQTYDEKKWKLAADAYKSFITEFVPSVYSLYRKNDVNGNFSPFLSCRDVMLEPWNSEVIFGRTADDANYAQERTPFHEGYNSEVRGSGTLSATQKQVDAFFMANGKSIDAPASGYAESGSALFKSPEDDKERETFNQWVNREPRFYVNITYDNRKWLNASTGEAITRLFYKGNSGKGTSTDYSLTGYIVRKGARLGDWHVGRGVIVMYRLANLYLDYVEALNEAEPENSDILLYLNMIRERAGIPGYSRDGIAIPQGKDQMRIAIRHERQVELSYENVRYFDTRRWKIAEDTDKGAFYGLDVEKEIPGFYKKVIFETRVFSKRHYLLPFPEQEVFINQELIQNTGW